MSQQLELLLPQHTPESFLREMHRRGLTRFRAVRLKANRSRLLSVSADGATLHVHIAYAGAPSDVLDAIATFLSVDRRRVTCRRALHTLRNWPGLRSAESDNRMRQRTPRPGRCSASAAARAELRAEYRRLNLQHFAGALPEDVALRYSDRMVRRFGHVRLWREAAGAPRVIELALNERLLDDENRGHHLDTLLHEMAHIEAWLVHGHRGHGRVWRDICARIGCEPRACSRVRLRR